MVFYLKKKTQWVAPVNHTENDSLINRIETVGSWNQVFGGKDKV